MRRLGCLSLAIILLSLPIGVMAQEGGGHTLYGDLKVDPKGDTGLKPQTFQVILYNSFGTVISRQSVPINGRYQFMNLFNGQYELAVELDNREIARVPVFLRMIKKTDIRQDVNLAWTEERPPGRRPEGGMVSAGGFHVRTPKAEELLRKAVDARSRQDERQAIKLLKEILADDPDDFQAWTELGSTYHNQGDIQEAEKAYAEAVKRNPDYALALLNFGKLRMLQKDFKDAIRMLSRAAELDPDRAEAHYFLGEAYLQTKKGSLAVESLNTALRLDPVGMADAHLRLGALYNAAGLKDRAADEYEKFLAKKPDYPDRARLQQYIRENKRP